MSNEWKNTFPVSNKMVLSHNLSSRIRPVVQIGFLFFTILLGFQFHSFVLSLRGSLYEPIGTRPPAVEAYLPISSLMSLIYFLKTGVANQIHPSGLVIFTLTLVLAVLIRRGFCSWICPIGTAAEYAHKTGKALFRKNLSLPKWLDIMLRSLKYALLGFFSYHILFMPVTALRDFIYGPYNRIADIKMYLFFSNISTTAAGILIAIGLFSLFFKNFWCRYVCPYGALLGIFSVGSPVSVRRNLNKCIACGKCGQACPNLIPVDTKNTVYSTECTACFNCVDACEVEGAIGISGPRGKPVISAVAYGVITVAVFFFIPLIAKTFGYWQSETPVELYRVLYDRIVEIKHP